MHNVWSPPRQLKLLLKVSSVATLILLLILTGIFPTQNAAAQGPTSTPPAPVSPDPAAAAQLAQQGATIAYSRSNGMAHFVGATLNQPIAVAGAGGTPEQAARGFFAQYGRLFGLTNQAQELTVARQRNPGNNRTVIRFQQVYQGIPVMGGELNVQVNAANQILSANGEISPGLNLSTTPTITAATASQTAINVVTKKYKVNAAVLTASKPTLWVYDAALLEPQKRAARLVWRVEVSATAIRELVLIDATTGGVVVYFNQIDVKGFSQGQGTGTNNAAPSPTSPALVPTNTPAVPTNTAAPFAPSNPGVLGTPLITIYDKNNQQNATLPGTQICTQANSAVCNSFHTDAAKAFEYAVDTYDFYADAAGVGVGVGIGRDSINGAGLNIKSTIRYCEPAAYGYPCPYPNAFWNGAQMVYGQGFSQADDVVGHELTHGVTQFESGLYYFYQSGAINESLSDVFGELIDQLNASGDDSPAAKWFMGEDVPGGGPVYGGAIRNMQNPTLFGHPDRMSSTDWVTDNWLFDNGGVHFNSGVNNKAAYLMTDGDTFNGITVTGLGIIKTAKIYYEAQANLLTSGSDYADLYNILYQACFNLMGTAGITSADCQEVRDATDATEMNQPPFGDPDHHAEICPSGYGPVNTFYDTFEAGFANWTLAVEAGANHWVTNDPFGPNRHSGTKVLFADDGWLNSRSTATTKNFITLQPNSYLHFYHFYDTEYSWDGGALYYSTNGVNWFDMGSLIDSGRTYDGSIDALFDFSGFTGSSLGYVSTRFDLSTLPSSVKFRWRFGTDSSNRVVGWWVDDVRIYRCVATPAITSFTPTSGPVGQVVTINGTDFNGATSVKFNNVTAPINTNNGTQITTVVPAGATTGKISVTGPGGTGTSATDFTVIPPPTVTGFSPSSGLVGASITITGTNFFVLADVVTDVSFGGVSASFTTNSATQITATVPVGALSGPISVTTVAGTAASSTNFNVLLNAPSGLTATTAGQMQINLSWADNSSVETHYQIERSTNGGAFTLIATVAAGTTSHQDLLLSCSEIYDYRVRAYRDTDGAVSNYSNQDGDTTSACTLGTATLLSPADGTLTNNNEPVFNWSAVASADEYQIQIDNNDDFSSPEQDEVVSTLSYAADKLVDGATYYWRVRALANSQTNSGPWSDDWTISIDQPRLPAPTLSLPANNARITTTKPTYTWLAVAGATKYELQVDDNDPNFGSPLNKTLGAVTTYTSLVADGFELSYGNIYYWRLRAGNASNVFSDWSTVRTFEVTVMLSPTDGAIWDKTATPTLSFTWAVPVGTSLHTREISVDPLDFSAPNLRTPPLTPGTYYWRVRLFYNGSFRTMRPWTFIVTQAKPAAPTLLLPTNLAKTTDTTPELSWNATTTGTGGPFEYQIQVSINSLFYNPIEDARLPDTTPYTTGTLADGVYYWRVRAINVDNAAGAWSLVRSFTIDTTPPAPPKLTAPANWAAVVTATGRPAFSWLASTGATQYVLQVYVSNGTDCLTPLGWSQTQAALTYTPTVAQALAPGDYCWTVQARDALLNTSLPSIANHFRITPTAIAAPGVPVLSTPLAATVTQDTTPDFGWTMAGSGFRFQIQIDTVSTFPNPKQDAVTLVDVLTYTASPALPDGNYFWRVRAINSSNVAGAFTAARAFSITNSVPAVPKQTAPAHNANLTVLTPAFTWQAATGAKTYKLQISRNAGFTDIAVNKLTVTPTTYTLLAAEKLAFGQHYWWRVKAVSASGVESAWSQVLEFTVTVHKTLVNGAGTTALRPVLTWQAVTGHSYRVAIARDSGFADLVVNPIPNIVVTSYTLPVNLTPGTTYYWKITLDNGSIQTEMPYWTFVVTPSIPVAPVLSSPAINSVNKDNTPTFVWKSVTNGVRYQIQIDDLTTFASPNQDVLNAPGVLTYTANTLPDGKYFWRVRTYNSVNAPGAWSAVWNVTIDSSGPAVPVLAGPADGTDITNPQVTLRWLASTSATAYEVRLDTVNPPQSPPIRLGAVLLYKTIPLKFGTYYWQVRALDASGNASAWSAVRSFKVIAGVSFAPALPTNTPSAPTAVPVAPATMITVEAESASVARSGSWTAQATASASGGGYLYSSGSTADALTLTFSGTKLGVSFVTHPAFGTFVVEIDGVVVRTVTTTRADATFGAQVTLDNLSAGTHTVRVYAQEGVIAIDAFSVEASK